MEYGGTSSGDNISCWRKEHHYRPCASTICCPQHWFLRIPFENLMRRIQCSIDPPPPFFSTLLQYRKFELESFPIRIENYVRQYPFALRFPADCDAVRERRPIRLIEFHAVPGKFLFAENQAQTHAVAFMFHVAHHT